MKNVISQGSANLLDTYGELEQQYFDGVQSSHLEEQIQVDYDVWYPFQWYVRHDERAGWLRFSCFRDEDGQEGCRAIEADPGSSAVLLAAHHRATKPGSLAAYEQSGPRRNLLWFPETYRRPGENRQSEPFIDEMKQDLLYFKEAATSREKWNQAINYLFTRQMDSEWFSSEYYTYLRRENNEPGAAN